jgi:hypothetical protein
MPEGAAALAFEERSDTVAQSSLPNHNSPHLQDAPQPQGETLTPEVFPLHIREAQEAFCRALPALLRDHPGKWVAYRGSTLEEVADSEDEVYRRCDKRGLDLGILLVRPVEELPEVDFIGPQELL